MSIFDIFKKKKPRPPVIKMYVLVRRDLEPIHRAVQGGHAVAEYMKTWFHTTPWNNGYMIYLSVANEAELNKWEARLQAAQHRFSTFVEPDWGEPTKTALAFCSTGEIVRGLDLLSMEPNSSVYTKYNMSADGLVKPG